MKTGIGLIQIALSAVERLVKVGSKLLEATPVLLVQSLKKGREETMRDDKVKRIIIDLSSVCWMSLLAGEDTEHGKKVEHEGKVVKVNSAQFGYENAMNHIAAAMGRFNVTPSNVIIVKEGMNQKILRKSMLPQYKEDRDSRPPEAYDEFNKLGEMIIEAMLSVGASSVSQDGLEGDDVIAYLCRHLQGSRIILSNDKDLAVLMDDPEVTLYRNGEVVEENPWGPFPYKYITLYKGLVGGKDNVPGAPGFGDKAFLNLLCIFGVEGLESLQDVIRRRQIKTLQEDVAELKALQKILDAEDLVYASYAVSRLYPDKVNTMRRPLQWRVGMVKAHRGQKDERLKPFSQQVRLIHSGNYEQAVKFALEKMPESPFLSIDIETSTPEASDEWLEALKKKSTGKDDNPGVDVFGSNLTGLGITFGSNSQYTFYFTVDHKETESIKNVTSYQVLEFLDCIDYDIPHVVHNSAFELSVLYQEWGEYWDNGAPWYGFMPNVHDTKILSSYVNENISAGLKKLSSHYIGYEQVSYAQVTTRTMHRADWENECQGRGRLIREFEAPEDVPGMNIGAGEPMVEVQFKMNELTAEEVLNYGADDTICTSALYVHFRRICEIESTWEVYKEVEIFPAYLTAKGYVDGVRISVETLKKHEKEDDEAYEKAWALVRDFLIKKGWEGTVCPVYTELTPANIKEAVLICYGEEFKTQVRTVAKFPPLLRDNGWGLLADLVEKGNLEAINQFVASKFNGEPKLDFGSPKQMKAFMYDMLGLPVRIINRPTPTERQDKPALAAACDKHQKIWRGSTSVGSLTEEEKQLLKLKAKTDDTAFDFALAMDADGEVKEVLEAIKVVKTVTTRRAFYYKPYPLNVHWKDGRVHSSMNQCATVTRRYSSSGPNLQQLPKKQEGIKIRDMIQPHKPVAVIVSIDFRGQELRLMAGQSLDTNMMACYVGDNLKDPHSITASGAMKKKWGAEVVAELFEEYGPKEKTDDPQYDLFVKLSKCGVDEIEKKADDLRKLGKNINFAAQFDAQAAKVAEMLVITVPEAQMFLDAKYDKFPRVETWKDEVRENLAETGFVTTMLGARRHLADALLSDNKDVAGKAERQGPNFKIQGSAAEMTKLAMTRFWLSGALHKYDAQFLGPIHDELVTSVTFEDALEFIKVKHECMTQPYATLPVPIMGSIALGLNFGTGQIECGDWFIPENIEKALEKCRKAFVSG